MSEYIVNLTTNGGMVKFDDLDVVNIKGISPVLTNIYYGMVCETLIETRNQRAIKLVELIESLDLHNGVVLLIGGTRYLFDLVCSLLPARRFIYSP